MYSSKKTLHKRVNYISVLMETDCHGHVIVTFTTIPARVQHIEPVVESICGRQSV